MDWIGLKADWTEKGIVVSWESGKNKEEWEHTFVLSRALDNGLDFKEVNSVVSNSRKGGYYILDDELPQIFNQIYYRITAYKENGDFYQSPLIRMDYRAMSPPTPKIFPNPYSGGPLEWELGALYQQELGQVQVYNGLGTRVLNGEINTMSSPGDFLYQLQKLPPGLYYVHFYAKTHATALRWIKLNY